MERAASVSCCYLGVLGLMLLQGVLSVEGRSMFDRGNHVFNPNEDTDVQSKILALLLHRGLIPAQQTNPLGLNLASKLPELEDVREENQNPKKLYCQLQALRDDLELEKELTANTLVDGKSSIPGKRGEPCFWKYCV